MENIIELRNLSVTLEKKHQAPVTLIHGIDVTIAKGAITGIVGESGSGKSLTMKALMNILPENLQAKSDYFSFDGHEINVPPQKRIAAAMIFQDPMTALNPVRTIEFHLVEVIQRFQKVSKKEARHLALAELEKVGITHAQQRLKQYPHELSGGMRQRVMIAMALLAKPDLLIADEPTTALDVTIQAQILSLIKNIQKEKNLSIVLVTHDFGVIASMSENLKVMYQGVIVEEGTTKEIFANPQHAYTKELLKAIPDGTDKKRLYTIKQPELDLSNQVFTELSASHRFLRAKEVEK